MLKFTERCFWKKNYIWTMLALFLLIAFILKFSILNKYVAPPGSDPGNYLFVAHAFQGNDIVGFGLRYPPIFYLLIGLLLQVFDEFMALKVMAGIVTTIIGVPFFLLAKKSSDGIIAFVSTTFFVFSFELQGIPAWGGYGNLLGIFFLLWFLVFLSRTLLELSKKNIFLTALSFALVFGTHVLVFIFTVLTIFIFSALALILNVRRTHSFLNCLQLKKLIVGTIMSFVLCLPFAPFYYLIIQDYPSSTSSSSLPQNLILESISRLEIFTFLFTALALVALSYLYIKEKEIKTTYLLIIALLLCPFLLSFVLPIFFSTAMRRIPIFWNISEILSIAVFLGLIKKWIFK